MAKRFQYLIYFMLSISLVSCATLFPPTAIPTPNTPKGLNSLFIGHSFFIPHCRGLGDHAERAGIKNHNQQDYRSGGERGAPQALWENTSKRAEVQEILQAGDIELFGMTYSLTYPDITGYKKWIDYALAQNNPLKGIFIGLPWGPNPADRPVSAYIDVWEEFHNGEFHYLIDTLRGLYPNLNIFCIGYGRGAFKLELLLESDNLPDISSLAGSQENSIYSDDFGHAGDMLGVLTKLVLLGAIYDLDLTEYDYDPGYKTDLKAIASDILWGHDSDYDSH